MRKMRTVLALMLALSLCLTMFPASIFAQEGDPTTEPVPAVETLKTEPEVEEEVDKAPEITTDLAEEEDETSQEPETEVLPEESESEEPAVTEEEQETEQAETFDQNSDEEPAKAITKAISAEDASMVDLEKKVEEDAQIEAVKKAEMPVEALVKASPVEEDRSMVKIASDAAMDALTTEANTKSENPRTIYVIFYIDYTGPNSKVYQRNNFPEGTKTLADIAPDVSDEKDGSVFMYWCHGNYNNKQQIPMDEPLVIKSDMDDTIYAAAKWGHIVEYVIDGEKVDYNYDDGFSHIMKDGVHIVEDGSFTSKPNVKKEGYIAEWPDSVKVTEDMTVEGQWVKVWTVRFVDENGNDLFDPQTVKENGYANEPKKEPTKEGFDFNGWFLNVENGDPLNYFDEDNRIPVTEDVTLVAQWTAKEQYTVAFYDESGNKIEDADQQVYEGDFAEPYRDYKPEDHEDQILVWNTKEADGTLSEYDFSTPVTENIDLYASWKDEFSVLYHVTDPDSFLGMSFDKTYPSTDAGKIELPTLEDISTELPGYNPPEGFKFVGWAASPKGDVLEPNEDGTYDLTALLEAKDSAATDDTVQPSAQSKPKQTSLVSGKTYQEVGEAENPGWTIIPGDLKPITQITYDLELYTVWEETFTIYYHTNYPKERTDEKPEDKSSVPVDPYEGLAEGAEKPEKFILKGLDDKDLEFDVPEGYEFAGWYIIYNAPATEASLDPPQSSVEFPWAKEERTDWMERLPNTGTNFSESDQQENGNVGSGEQEEDQWTGDSTQVTSGTSDKLYQPTQSYGIYRKVDVYAIWRKKPVVAYHTHYVANGIEGMEEADYQDNNEAYTAKAIVEKKDIDVLSFDATGFKEPNGYAFDHWVVKYEGDDPTAESPVMPEFDINTVEEETESSKDNNLEAAVKDKGIRYPGKDKQRLLLRVDFNAVYVPANWVQYNSNYPAELNLAVQLANDNIPKDKVDIIYNVLSLEDVTKKNSEFKAPLGYKFLGWSLDDPDQTEKLLNAPDDTITLPGEKQIAVDETKPAVTPGSNDPGSVQPIDLNDLPNKIDVMPLNPSSGLISADSTSDLTEKAALNENEFAEKDGGTGNDSDVPDAPPANSDMPPESDTPTPDVAESTDNKPLHIFYAQWEKVYTARWVDDEGNPIEGFDPVQASDPSKLPGADYYKETSGKEPKENKDGLPFARWDTEDKLEETGVITYIAVYGVADAGGDPDNETPGDDPAGDPVTPTNNNPSRPSTPATTEDPVTEEPTEIDDGDTPLAPGTVEEEDTNIDDGDVPLAGAEEEDEIAEEATPLTPFTGDERHTAVWGIVSILSLLGIVLLTYKRRREE